MLDFLIRQGKVVDGTGGPSYTADVAVKDGRIVEVGDLPQTEAAIVIEAAGKIVCPGFIDIHTHNDLYVIRDNYLDLFESYLRQGITTCVANNCGWSVAPWPEENSQLFHSTLHSMGVSYDFQPQWRTQEEFHRYLERRGMPINFVPLAAHGPIRIAVMGDRTRFCNEEELGRMKQLVAAGMEAGCRGFSTGLTYFPGMYAHTDEVVELAKVCAGYGGRYVTHVRGHCNTYDRAVQEAIEIARRSGCALQLSHVFAVPFLGHLADALYHLVGAIERINRIIPLPGVPNAVLKKAVGIVDRAIDEGLEVGMDFIPYVLGNTTVTQLYPPWANVGGTEGLLRRLADPEERKKIRHDVENLKPRWPHWEPGSWSDNYLMALGWNMLYILSVGSERNRRVEGRRVVELAKEAGKDPFEWLADLVLEEEGAVTFLFGLPPRPWSEKVFIRVQGHPQLSVGSDVLFPEMGAPPQSACGCFVRIIEHYVKELNFYTLENAIHRCTGLSASRFGLSDRGVVRKGAAADLVVFDYERIHDNSTFDDTQHFPDGIEYVMVNGKVVVDQGIYHGDVLAGELLTLR
jgi:N-acyl-D-aspartate/D-glutamate deacylase